MSSHISREMRSRDGARVLACLSHALHDRAGVVGTKGEEIKNGISVGFGVELLKRLLFSRHHDQGIPAQPVLLVGLFKHHVIVHIEDARRILGALDVARHPEQGIGDPGEHLGHLRSLRAAPRYPCCRRPAMS